MTDQPMGGTSEQPEDTAPTTPPPPAESSAPTPPPAGGTSYDMAAAKQTLREAHKFDLGIVAAAVVALIGSWLPFYTISVGGIVNVSGHISGWHGFFGWFAVLVALAAAVLVALPLFGVNLSLPVPVAQAALAGFGLALLCMILALFITPGGGCPSGLGISCDTGRGFGYWLALLAILAGTALAFLRAKDSRTKTA
jgi:hypothetical protein